LKRDADAEPIGNMPSFLHRSAVNAALDLVRAHQNIRNIPLDELEPVLAERGVGSLLISGAQTDACIRSTLHGAITRGYDATLVDDAHTTEDLTPYGAPPPDKVIAHTNLYWQFQRAPGRTAGTVSTADVDFAVKSRA